MASSKSRGKFHGKKFSVPHPVNPCENMGKFGATFLTITSDLEERNGHDVIPIELGVFLERCYSLKKDGICYVDIKNDGEHVYRIVAIRKSGSEWLMGWYYFPKSTLQEMLILNLDGSKRDATQPEDISKLKSYFEDFLQKFYANALKPCKFGSDCKKKGKGCHFDHTYRALPQKTEAKAKPQKPQKPPKAEAPVADPKDAIIEALKAQVAALQTENGFLKDQLQASQKKPASSGLQAPPPKPAMFPTQGGFQMAQNPYTGQWYPVTSSGTPAFPPPSYPQKTTWSKNFMDY